jgi:hypothetical protein
MFKSLRQNPAGAFGRFLTLRFMPLKNQPFGDKPSDNGCHSTVDHSRRIARKNGTRLRPDCRLAIGTAGL